MSASGPLVATSLPAEVPAPTPTALPPLRLSHLSAPSGDAPATAVRLFFDAYLAGHGDPGPGLTAVTPPPFTSVALMGIAVGPSDHAGERTVRAEVAGIDASGRKAILDYSLQIADRSGGWLVTAVLPAAPLAR
jgi:hypothetical protein